MAGRQQQGRVLCGETILDRRRLVCRISPGCGCGYGERPANHAVAMRRFAGPRRGHEVLHLPHSVGHQERVMRMLVSGR